jgi:small subunit ribosomal protein S16
MALTIRLRPQGRNNRQTYRVVVTDSRNPIDGKYLEMLGFYDPLLEVKGLEMNEERIRHWLGVGAQVSHQVASLMAKAAPDALKELKGKRQAKQVKQAAERRALKRTTRTAVKPSKPAAAKK